VIADLHSEHVHRETSGGHIPLGGYAPYVLWNLYFFLDLAISCRSEIASEFLNLWRTNSRTSNGRLEFFLCLLYEPDIWHKSGFLLGVNEILMHGHINAQCTVKVYINAYMCQTLPSQTCRALVNIIGRRLTQCKIAATQLIYAYQANRLRFIFHVFYEIYTRKYVNLNISVCTTYQLFHYYLFMFNL